MLLIQRQHAFSLWRRISLIFLLLTLKWFCRGINRFFLEIHANIQSNQSKNKCFMSHCMKRAFIFCRCGFWTLARLGGLMQPLMSFLADIVKTAARSAAKLLINLYAHVLNFWVQVSGHQVTKGGTISGSNFDYIYAPVPPPVSNRFLSNFQGVLSSPSCTTYRPFFILLTWGQREVMT